MSVSTKTRYQRAQELHFGAFSFGQDLFNQGVGVDVDSAVAEYLELAALDFAPAQHWLGYCYLEGVGLDQDPRAALRWLEMAAARGFANAFHCLAWCYEHGHGVDEDQERAASLYGEAVELKFAQSCANLGWMYIEGRGVKRYNWGALRQGFGCDAAGEGVSPSLRNQYLQWAQAE